MVRFKSLDPLRWLPYLLLAASICSTGVAQDVPSRAQAINGQHSNGKDDKDKSKRPVISMPGGGRRVEVQVQAQATDPVQLVDGTLYIFSSTVPCRIVVSPRGSDIVKISTPPKAIRPLFVNAVFPDSEVKGKDEWREYTDEFIWVVKPNGIGTVEVSCLPNDPNIEEMWRKIEVNLGPRPPPQPPGPTPPGPQPPGPVPPGPSPIFKDLRVLIIEESADRGKLPAKQREILFDAQVRKWLNDNCKVGPDGVTREWVIPDQDQDLSGYSKELDELRKRPRKSLPWIIIEGDGNVLYEDALPNDVPSALALLNKYKPTAR